MDGLALDLNQHLGEQLKRFPLAFLPLHTPLLFQTFRQNELINKSVYYLSKEVGDGFAVASVSHSWSPYDALSHSLRCISVMCFDRFVTGHQKLNHHQESQRPIVMRWRVI